MPERWMKVEKGHSRVLFPDTPIPGQKTEATSREVALFADGHAHRIRDAGRGLKNDNKPSLENKQSDQKRYKI